MKHSQNLELCHFVIHFGVFFFAQDAHWGWIDQQPMRGGHQTIMAND
jgi:hypothetical protein